MALTRKFLSALGIDEEKADEIIKAHTDTTDALKEERDRFKGDAEKLPNVQKELDDLKKQVDGDNPFEQKFNDLKKEFDEYKTEVENKELTSKKVVALKKALKEIGIPEKRFDAIVRLSDLNKIELEDDGNVKDAETLKERLKSDWADYISTESVQGANVDNPPNNTGGTMSKDDILKIKDTAARQKAMAENAELFGIS